MILQRDTGQLWENYCLSERQKINNYMGNMARPFFWRTYDRQEIDYVETNGDEVAAFEIKWKEEKAKLPVAFKNAYPGASFKVIQRENYLDWIVK